MSRKVKMLVVVLVVILAVGAGGCMMEKKEEAGFTTPRKADPVSSVETLKDAYDVIVVGTDPEGIAAAVSASRNGLRTLLIESRNRQVLGGLMTVGWLNSIDMNWDRTSSPLPGQEYDFFNKGIFAEWYGKTEGHSFDITTAANAFYDLVKAEKNIDLYMNASSIMPIVNQDAAAASVEGIAVTKPDGEKRKIGAKAVIDATQDADLAAAAGVSFTDGREDLGDKQSRMAVTAVFRLKNVDDRVWQLIAKRLDGDGDGNTGINKMSAWGYGSEMKDYVPLDKERTKMRGLNIGRQKDGTVLINALQIFGIDGLDPQSRQEGLEIAAKEIPNVVKYLKKLKEFKHVELDAIAPELYVRETRHMIGLYRLNVVDLLENRDQWDRIAFGSYPADIQRTSPSDDGIVVVHPLKYAIPFRSIVPDSVDGLLVVGRSAGYDTLAHGSARVIPTGMAEGQAAGAAAKLAIEHGTTFRNMAKSETLIAELQQRLNDQGMELKPYKPEPQSFMSHPAYAGLKAALYMGLTSGSYNNETFDLDKPSNAQRIVNEMNNIRRMYKDHFKGDPSAALKNVPEPAKQKLTLQQASFTIAQAIGWHASLDDAQTLLESKGLLSADTVSHIKDKNRLTDGDVFLMLKDVVEKLTGFQFL